MRRRDWLKAIAALAVAPMGLKFAAQGTVPGPSLPVGIVAEIPPSHPGMPKGWLVLNGQTISRSEYPDLYRVIGASYGGQGEQFRLPCFRAAMIKAR